MKTVRDYYLHTRSFGFPPADCIRLARQAVALDIESRRARMTPPGSASYEVLPDGSGCIRLSNSVMVF